MTGNLITILSINDDNIPFIVHSWSLGYYYNNRTLRRFTEKRAFVRTYGSFVAKKLKKITVFGAVNPSCLDQIYGYIAFEPLPCGNRVLHYIYTKEPFRRCGIATKLLAEAQIPVPRFKRVVVTHWTQDFFKLWRELHRDIPPLFMPWVFTEGKGEATRA
jgi:GNAT superfamily N-acetyltransferase